MFSPISTIVSHATLSWVMFASTGMKFRSIDWNKSTSPSSSALLSQLSNLSFFWSGILDTHFVPHTYCVISKEASPTEVLFVPRFSWWSRRINQRQRRSSAMTALTDAASKQFLGTKWFLSSQRLLQISSSSLLGANMVLLSVFSCSWWSQSPCVQHIRSPAVILCAAIVPALPSMHFWRPFHSKKVPLCHVAAVNWNTGCI